MILNQLDRRQFYIGDCLQKPKREEKRGCQHMGMANKKGLQADTQATAECFLAGVRGGSWIAGWGYFCLHLRWPPSRACPRHVLAQAPGCHGRLPGPQDSDPSSPRRRTARPGRGPGLAPPFSAPGPLPGVPPGLCQHRGLRTAPPAPPPPAPPRGVMPAGPRRAPPAAPRPPLALQRPAAAGLTDLLGCRHRRSSGRRRRRRRRCRHVPALAAAAATTTVLPAAAAPRSPAPAPWRGGRGPSPSPPLPSSNLAPPRQGGSEPEAAARARRPGGGLRARLPTHRDSTRPRAASGFLQKGALKIQKTPLPFPSIPHHEGQVPPRVLLAARAGISLERGEYAWTRKVVIMWPKLTSSRLGIENLENRDPLRGHTITSRDPLRGHTITSGMLLSSGGPVKSDAFFCSIGGGLKIVSIYLLGNPI